MAIGNRSIGGDRPVDRLRDQAMMFLRRLRLETAVDSQDWMQLSLLAAIDRLGDDANPTALSRDMNARSSNIATALRDAERRDHVTRAVDPSDRRRSHILLTERGREALTNARDQRSRWLSAAVDELDAEEQRTLFRAGELLERLATGAATSLPAVR